MQFKWNAKLAYPECHGGEVAPSFLKYFIDYNQVWLHSIIFLRRAFKANVMQNIFFVARGFSK